MDEQTTEETYTPPMLAEVGEFSEDTLGGSGWYDDFIGSRS